jgi:hypothetical protein
MNWTKAFSKPLSTNFDDLQEVERQLQNSLAKEHLLSLKSGLIRAHLTRNAKILMSSSITPYLAKTRGWEAISSIIESLPNIEERIKTLWVLLESPYIVDLDITLVIQKIIQLCLLLKDEKLKLEYGVRLFRKSRLLGDISGYSALLEALIPIILLLELDGERNDALLELLPVAIRIEGFQWAKFFQSFDAQSLQASASSLYASLILWANEQGGLEIAWEALQSIFVKEDKNSTDQIKTQKKEILFHVAGMNPELSSVLESKLETTTGKESDITNYNSFLPSGQLQVSEQVFELKEQYDNDLEKINALSAAYKNGCPQEIENAKNYLLQLSKIAKSIKDRVAREENLAKVVLKLARYDIKSAQEISTQVLIPYFRNSCAIACAIVLAQKSADQCLSELSSILPEDAQDDAFCLVVDSLTEEEPEPILNLLERRKLSQENFLQLVPQITRCILMGEITNIEDHISRLTKLISNQPKGLARIRLFCTATLEVNRISTPTALDVFQKAIKDVPHLKREVKKKIGEAIKANIDLLQEELNNKAKLEAFLDASVQGENPPPPPPPGMSQQKTPSLIEILDLPKSDIEFDQPVCKAYRKIAEVWLPNTELAQDKFLIPLNKTLAALLTKLQNLNRINHHNQEQKDEKKEKREHDKKELTEGVTGELKSTVDAICAIPNAALRDELIENFVPIASDFLPHSVIGVTERTVSNLTRSRVLSHLAFKQAKQWPDKAEQVALRSQECLFRSLHRDDINLELLYETALHNWQEAINLAKNRIEHPENLVRFFSKLVTVLPGSEKILGKGLLTECALLAEKIEEKKRELAFADIINSASSLGLTSWAWEQWQKMGAGNMSIIIGASLISTPSPTAATWDSNKMVILLDRVLSASVRDRVRAVVL